MGEAGIVELLKAVADLHEYVPHKRVGQPLPPCFDCIDKVMKSTALGKFRHIAKTTLKEEGAMITDNVGVGEVQEELHLFFHVVAAAAEFWDGGGACAGE